MIARFEITSDVFDRGLDESEQYYVDYYKDQGFILNMSDQECYKDYNREIKLSEGDRIEIANITWIVKFKCYYVDEDIIKYYLIIE